jgi:hypothetical protein
MINNMQPIDDITFHGLNQWYKNLFEKLGWMVLKFKKGNQDKVKQYTKSIEHFLLIADKKLDQTQDFDQKQDILIMINDVISLFEHVKEDFGY